MREEKVTKNIITKETIANDLLRENNKALVVFIIYFLSSTLIASILSSIFYSFILQSRAVGSLSHVIFAILELICFLPSIILALLIFSSIFQIKKIKNGNFVVVTDEVAYKWEKTEFHRYGRRGPRIPRKTIHFRMYGDVHTDKSCYQIATSDDVFYIVVFSKPHGVPQKLYPAKLYEYKE